jgi:hypothetical protein
MSSQQGAATDLETPTQINSAGGIVMYFARTFIAALFVTIGGSALAQTNINQASATAGNVTPGDAVGFPITISQSGSYKLTGNLLVPANTAGIEITAPNVTLDMNGFSLVSENTCTQNVTTRLVTCTGVNLARHGIATGLGSVIRNGNIQGFAGAGVALLGGRELLENLSVTENMHTGISVGGSATSKHVRVVDCVVELNGGHGMWLVGGVVSGSRVVSNYGRGIEGNGDTLVSHSVVQRNYGIGISGVTASNTISTQNQPNRGAGVVGLGSGMNRDGNNIY